MRRWRGAAALALAVLLGACGTLPAPAARPPTMALEPSADSPLVKINRASLPAENQSGVRLMPIGAFSLDARLQLAQRAKNSLDVQYYVFENDPTGRLLMVALRDAALRGVRVRLLVDDLYTTHTDRLLRDLAAYPNFEVHLFNPFCCARSAGVAGRYTASLFDFGRLNHRMHNKLFIADGVMAVVGGRNIADEYFVRNAEQNFIDMDAFVMGAVVKDFAAIFDRYWNSVVVLPIEAVGQPLGDKAARRRDFDATLAALPPAPPVNPPSTDVLGYGPIAEELDSGQIGLVWGSARAFADPPEKLLGTSQMAYETSVTNNVMMQVWQAKSELVLTSPYMIPGDMGLKSFQNLQHDKVKVVVMTNSLAATDEPLVHNGYAKYRPGMLAAGVDLYELSPTRSQHAERLGVLGGSLGRLHAKTAVIDRHLVFIGSMNLDPRSASANTELGMFVESPALAKELLRVINISKLESAYRVRLEPPKGPGLQWLTLDDDRETILGVEPESHFWGRVQNMFLGWFVPEQLL
ncbi:MAG: phospholipase D family protein, partial [Pseudomonadota bacterium]|nr:phospholipase D family protein [Pseudomonadota bacterium]